MADIEVNAIQDVARTFTENSSLNKVEELNSLQLFDAPLIGVAYALDPLFTQLKEADAVGPQHLLPQEWLAGDEQGKDMQFVQTILIAS